MFLRRFLLPVGLALIAAIAPAMADTTILNVSYDVSRELYKDINPAFAAAWKAKSGETVSIKQSHGGSSKQALSVLSGLEADVVTMNQSTDIEILAEKGLVAKDWRNKFPFGATPYITTIVFLVRKGNPKGIKDWKDLLQPGLQVIIPNPKTSGNGRYTYVSALGYALQTRNDPAAAKDFLAKLFANVPVLDGGGRGASTTFAQNGIGDVLVTFENEAIAIQTEMGAGKFDTVYPSLSVEAAPPVAVVDSVVDKKGTRAVATAYLNFLFTPEAQDIIAKHNFRPRDPAAIARNAGQFRAIKTFTVEDKLGGWPKVQAEHFSEGGIYDQIMAARR